MKNLTSHVLLIAAMILMAASCSKKGNDDADSLLRTIPADASSVVLVNLQQTLSGLDCKTDGTTITLSKEMEKTISESKAVSDRNKQIFRDVCEGKTGVSISSLAFFSAARSYVTGLLNDPDKFVAYASGDALRDPLDSVPAPKITEVDGARIIGNTVVIGNQFWICTAGTPDVEQLKYYQNLNDRQSYASNETAPLLLTGDKVVTYVADVKRSFDRLPESTYMRMGASLMFEDIAYVAGSAHFEKKSVISSSQVLNSDMKPANLLLPTEKIDASLVKSLDANGDVFVAAGLSKKLSKKISDALSSIMGPNAKGMASALEQIDGTSAICLDLNNENMTARIETTGKDFATLSNMLQIIPGISVTRDGDTVNIRYGTGTPSGAMSAAQAADKMKGAWIAVIASGTPAQGMTTVARLIPENKSLKLDVEIDGGVDALITALFK